MGPPAESAVLVVRRSVNKSNCAFVTGRALLALICSAVRCSNPDPSTAGSFPPSQLEENSNWGICPIA